MMQNKECSKCKIIKPLDDFKRYKGKLKKDGSRSILIRSSCKLCDSEMTKKWFENNHGYKKKWRKENPEKVKQENFRSKERIKKWHQDNKIILLQKQNERRRKDKELNGTEKYRELRRRSINNLTDGYVVGKIVRDSSLKASDIYKYPELIEAKRLIIKHKRHEKHNRSES